MVAASLASLQLAGCFVEVGKRDIWSSQRMAQERPDVAYHLIAIDFLPPHAIHVSMLHISALLAAGMSSLATHHYDASYDRLNEALAWTS